MVSIISCDRAIWLTFSFHSGTTIFLFLLKGKKSVDHSIIIAETHVTHSPEKWVSEWHAILTTKYTHTRGMWFCIHVEWKNIYTCEEGSAPSLPLLNTKAYNWKKASEQKKVLSEHIFIFSRNITSFFLPEKMECGVCTPRIILSRKWPLL